MRGIKLDRHFALRMALLALIVLFAEPVLPVWCDERRADVARAQLLPESRAGSTSHQRL